MIYLIKISGIWLGGVKQTRTLKKQSSHHGSAEMNLTSIHEEAGSIPSLTQWVKDLALL